MAGGIVAVASAMGGHFGRDTLRRPRARRPSFAGAGGGVGLIKCLAMEWPGCLLQGESTSIPIESPAQPGRAPPRRDRRPGSAAARSDTRVARARSSARPRRRCARRDGGDRAAGPGLGGAGGGRRARHHGRDVFALLRPPAPSCVVVGRSPLPGLEDRRRLPRCANAAALRAHFLAEAACRATRPTPAKIEARIAAVLRDREIRANMADFVGIGRADRLPDLRRAAGGRGRGAAGLGLCAIRPDRRGAVRRWLDRGSA